MSPQPSKPGAPRSRPSKRAAAEPARTPKRVHGELPEWTTPRTGEEPPPATSEPRSVPDRIDR